MSNNFINWLLGIGPNQFSIEQQLPHPPKLKDEDNEEDHDEIKPIDPNSTCLGPPRC